MMRTNRIRWKESSTLRFFGYAIGCFMAIVMAFTILYSLFTYRNERDHLNDGLRNIASTHVPALTACLWVTDDVGVQGAIDAMARYRYIARVEVRDDEGRKFFSGRAADPTMEVVSTKLEYRYKDQSVPIGFMSLFIGKRQMLLSVLRSALLVLVLQVGLSVLLAGLMAWAYHMAIGRHLRRFAQFIESDDPSQARHPFMLARRNKDRDELQLLVDHFNDLRDRISDYIGKMKAANDELIYINEQLLERGRQLRKREEDLKEVISKLQKALDEIRTLRGIVPICSSCKKIRNDKGYWEQVEAYVSKHTEAQFSHSICPDCVQKLYPEFSEGEKAASE